MFSLVISNDWKDILLKIFLNYSDKTISLTFPHLQCLIFPTYRITSMISFLDYLYNLPKLFEMKRMSLY
jgi:hypothetical protein